MTTSPLLLALPDLTACALDAESPRCPQPRLCRVRLMQHQLSMLLRCRHIELRNEAPPAGINSRLPPRSAAYSDAWAASQPSGVRGAGSRLMPPMPAQMRASHAAAPTPHCSATPASAPLTLGFMMDPPGSGKTYVAACLAAQDVEIGILKTKPTERSPKLPTLIVVPQHLLHQWVEAVEDVTGASATPLAALSAGRDPAGAGEVQGRAAPVTWGVFEAYSDAIRLYSGGSQQQQLAMYHIILTTSLLYDTLITTAMHTGFVFHRVIFDEVDTLCSTVKRLPPCRRLWFISATMGPLFSEHQAELRFRFCGQHFPMQGSELQQATCICDAAYLQDSVRLSPPEYHRVVIRWPPLDVALPRVTGRQPLIDAGAVQQRLSALDAVTIDSVRYAHVKDILARYAAPDGGSDSGSDCSGPCPSVEPPPLQPPGTKRLHVEVTLTVDDRARPLCVTAEPAPAQAQVRLVGAASYYLGSTVLYGLGSGQFSIYKDLPSFVGAEEPGREHVTRGSDRDALTAGKARAPSTTSARGAGPGEQGEALGKADWEPPGDEGFEGFEGADPAAGAGGWECPPVPEEGPYAEQHCGGDHRQRKLNALLDVLSQVIDTGGANSKVMIVADNSMCLDAVRAHLDSHMAGCVQCLYLDAGNAHTFAQTVRQYKQSRDPCSALLLDASLLSHGINLQATHAVVFMHRLGEETERQVVGRAQRPGRGARLHVWQLCFESEGLSLDQNKATEGATQLHPWR